MHTRYRALVILAGVGTVLLWPDVAQLRSIAAGPAAAVRVEGADGVIGALAGGLSWLLCVWLTCCAVLVALGRLPGLAGSICQRLGQRATPAILRRVVAGAVGASITLTPAAAFAGPGDGGAPIPASVAAPSPSPSIQWPLSDSASAPSPAWPISPGPAGAAPQSERTVRVAAGDTLWSLASAELGSSASTEDIAAYWPRWHSANADAIGPDPNLIQPGMTLQVPPREDPR